MRVLIAEDDGVSRLVLRKALEDLGYTVHAVKDGTGAWEAFQKESFPLVISDWMMPGMDGIELCRRIRSRSGRGYVYFILLTARDTREDRLHAIESGADDFLSKPLDRAELASRLSVARRILDMEQRLRQANEELARQKEELELKTQALEMSQEMIQQANLRFRELFDNVPVACFTFDAEGIIYEWNRAATNLYGWQEYEVLSQSMFHTIITPENEEAMRNIISQVMDGEKNITVEHVDRCRDGSRRHVLRALFPLHGASGEVVGGICASVDITQRVQYERELRALNERLESLAFTDALTGLYNHRALQDRLAESFNLARDGKGSFSFILLDIDHFKRFNDTYGHQAGDEVLRLVAQVLREHSPPDSVTARYGGEELAVLLPGFSLDEAIAVAEGLRCAIAEAKNPYRQITASFGVAEYKPYMHAPSEVVEVADAALYEAKRAGRNCVRPLPSEKQQEAA
ncbi:MAG: diguanylate cyclase [Chthonomonadetes bacterium]|nr:diguanylate cyclase [Chthonomonadetes bacterium]